MRQKALVVFIGIMALAAPLYIAYSFGDVLYLKDGKIVEGTYLGGNESTIRFKVEGQNKSYNIADVDEVQFSDSTSSARSSASRTDPRSSTTSSSSPATAASERFVSFQNSILRINHPDNWEVTRDGDDSVTIAPSGGRVQDRSGNTALAVGATISVFQPTYSYSQGLQTQSSSAGDLEGDTNRLIEHLRNSNPSLRALGSRQSMNVGGEQALSMRLTNDSPSGGLETDWLITVDRPEGLLYIIFTAPEREFSSYQETFRQMLNSVRFDRS
jgi:hypothetical protein